MKKNNVDLSSFKEVFSSGVASCVTDCNCGKTFYDRVNFYDWGEGEVERLIADETATPLDYSVRTLEFENRSFVVECNCWQDRAANIICWLNANAGEVGEFFRLEKKRKIAEAERIPVDIKFPFPEGFRSMVGAPKNATNIEVLMEDGHIQIAHWAQDLSGECQPAFQGWFRKSGAGYAQIDEPIAWKPIEKK